MISLEEYKIYDLNSDLVFTYNAESNLCII